MAADLKATPAVKKGSSTGTRKSKTTTVKDSQFRNFTPYKLKRGEAYMSEGQLAHLREILVNWRRELMEEVDRTVNYMQDDAANFPDPADRATQEEEWGTVKPYLMGSYQVLWPSGKMTKTVIEDLEKV